MRFTLYEVTVTVGEQNEIYAIWSYNYRSYSYREGSRIE